MTVKTSIWFKVFERDKGICQYCKINLLQSFSVYFSATVDHIVARSAGGTDNLENLACCCPACNSMLSRQKNLKTLEERKSYVLKRREEVQEKLESWIGENKLISRALRAWRQSR